MMFKPITQFLTPIVRTTVQRHSSTVISSPPTQKVSSAEKWILGGGMCLATLFIPAWVLYHIREYRGSK